MTVQYKRRIIYYKLLKTNHDNALCCNGNVDVVTQYEILLVPTPLKEDTDFVYVVTCRHTCYLCSEQVLFY